jgi:hypothetical protein
MEADLNRSIHRTALAAALVIAVLGGCAEEKTCKDFCGEGSACVGDACIAVDPCSPACGIGDVCQGAGIASACVPLLSSACSAGCATDQICVTSGGASACVGVCGEGQAWNSTSKVCEATSAYCGEGQAWNAGTLRCEATGAYCGDGQTWDAVALECVTTNVHAAWLTGPFTKGEDVTAACLACHAKVGDEMLASAHFKWAGPTPGLRDAAGNVVNDGLQGKATLINDFCVAVPSNEGRCGECHAGYADVAQKKLAYQLPPDAKRVDCLICHADLSTGYIKAVKNFGVADARPTTGCSPACASTQTCLPLAAGPTCVTNATPEYAAAVSDVLLKAAKSVRSPGRDNCGKCHFYAGGGDNVKMGDLASSLANPANASVDVHMGSANPAVDTCADCHAASAAFRHDQMKGTGLSVAMVKEADVACADCHGTPTASIHTPEHLAAIACQTCHIPAFSRQVATKTDWNWSVAGYKDCNYPGAPPALVAACDLVPTSATFGTAKVVIGGVEWDYNWQKGVFLMEKNVTPAYRWYDGTAFHQTIAGAMKTFDPAKGAVVSAPVSLSAPAAVYGDPGARIAPFKLMTGMQAMMKDGSFVVVPHVFGTWSLWGTKPDPTDATKSIPVVPATTTAPTGAKYGDHATYAEFLDALWNDLLSFGAASSGQFAPLATVAAGGAVRDTSGDVTLAVPGHGLATGARVNVMTADAGFAPGIKVVTAVDASTLRWHEAALAHPAAAVTSTQAVKLFRALERGADWEWGYTEMFMNINHEVAPRASAVGSCSACHTSSATPVVPVCGLYAAGSKPWGCP